MLQFLQGAILLIALLVAACAHNPHPITHPQNATPYASLTTLEGWVSPTHIAFIGDLEWVVNWGNNELLYRSAEEMPWQISPLKDLRGPHSLASLDGHHVLLADTRNHRLVRFANTDQGQILAETKTLAGHPLHKPHDVIADHQNGWFYALDEQRVFRFRDFGVEESVLELEKLNVRYARSLTAVHGQLYVIDSSGGRVLRVDDFARGKITAFQSAGKKKLSAAGSWQGTGLVLNDVEYFDGYWYGSNFFHETKAKGFDANIFRLIRWQTWEDFALGHWQDLSDTIPNGLVPYNFTIHQGRLFVALHAPNRALHGAIYLVAKERS